MIFIVPDDFVFLHIGQALVPALVFAANEEWYSQDSGPRERRGIELITGC